MLRDRSWNHKYTVEGGDLVRRFYVPALEDAERYDRLTGYFNAQALALAARGIESLVRNGGKMRLVVGCTLEPPEIEAIEKGEQLRALVESRMASLPLAPPDPAAEGALELLAWMVARGILQVRVAVPCDANGRPTPDDGIFHEKTGIVEDRDGDRLAWTGSLNETGAGWSSNWESISVHTSWGPEPARVDTEERSFARVWAGEAQRVIVLDVPEALRRDLMRFMPETGLPDRLRAAADNGEPIRRRSGERAASPPDKPPPAQDDLQSRVWRFIEEAPSRSGGEQVAEATAPVTPWPHQARAFERLYGDWPPRLLIADEVGLGKTIQAGLLLRQAWLARCAKRILILAPKAVLGQWQLELREKFNLNWPIYNEGKLTWYPSPALCGQHERAVERGEWHREPAVIASSQLMRRNDRRKELLEDAQPWDLVVLDEAHHARRRGAGSQREGRPNTLLELARGIRNRTQGLVLLTATPMQVHPVEVWDLLDLLGLPQQWTEQAFLQFFDDIAQPNPSSEAMERMASLFRSAEDAYGAFETAAAQRVADLSKPKANKLLRALRDVASIPRRQLRFEERGEAVAIMRANTPVRRLVSRNTRELLRRYFQQGMMTTPVAKRQVKDRFLKMSDAERAMYDAVEEYIASAYGKAEEQERPAVGFVMTIYRRRLASSFVALRETLHKRRDAMAASVQTGTFGLEEDLPDDEALDESLDTEEAASLERKVLAREQAMEIETLLQAIKRLPPDTKLHHLRNILHELWQEGHKQAMIFTQYTDTMDFLRDALLDSGKWKLLCFSGRGGEVAAADGRWRQIKRDDAKRRFRDGEADILLCTDAAAEGLNFQFCGALINYDMPWNPMRVEQRIGRIDRLGQRNAAIRIVNMHYEDTVETDIYRALRERIGLFQAVVGPLQPILARLPGRISQSVLSGASRDARKRSNLVDAIEREAAEQRDTGFDLDSATDSDLAMPESSQPIVTMEDLDRVITSEKLMPPGVKIRSMGRREYEFLAPGMEESLRVTTDPEYFEEHAESVELWSPGNPLFKAPEFLQGAESASTDQSLQEILDGD